MTARDSRFPEAIRLAYPNGETLLVLSTDQAAACPNCGRSCCVFVESQSPVVCLACAVPGEHQKQVTASVATPDFFLRSDGTIGSRALPFFLRQTSKFDLAKRPP